MATLVLTAVGTLVGGPIGGAIGAAAGNAIDRSLFQPKAARGPRLASLAVQSSAYGTALPRVFGTMRLAGSVIWATDLVEDRHRQGGGKGAPGSTTYSYSASLAVALSARPVRRIGRIWADGNLLRGAGGDWKSAVAAFRLHPGDEAQGVDPLIAASEGPDGTPAYRGIAYAVFEGLQLADFGNRIPALSFEVVADEAPVTLRGIAAALSGGAVRGPEGPALAGHAADGDSVRGAIEGLAAALPVAIAADAEGLRLIDEAAAATELPAAEAGAGATIEQAAPGTLVEAMTIAYLDPARDHQPATQSARRGAAGRRAGTIELPAAIDAAAARAIAGERLAREWTGRTRATVTLPWRRLGIVPGDMVTLPGRRGRWRVARRAFESQAVTLECVAAAGAGEAVAVAATAGRAAAAPDRIEGETRIALLDLPGLGDAPEGAAVLRIAAAGRLPGWRRATLIGSLDDGASWSVIGATAAPAVIGAAVTALPAGSPFLVDEAGAVEVALLHDGMALAGEERLGLAGAGNLALLGDELIRFGEARATGPGRYRLSRLLRGRRGTDWAIAGHAAGERFVLVEAEALVDWALPLAAIGARVRVAATGLGDGAPATAAIAFGAAALRPPAPVALRARAGADGSVALGWTRRSRAGWAWRAGGDAPIGEEREAYRVTLSGAGGSVAIETAQAALTVSAATLAALGPGAVTAAVAQLGTVAPSAPPATLVLASGA